MLLRRQLEVIRSANNLPGPLQRVLDLAGSEERSCSGVLDQSQQYVKRYNRGYEVRGTI